MTTPPDIDSLTLSLSTLKITTMPLEVIKPKTITGLDALDFDKKNYVRWAEAALDAFLYGGICEYVLVEVPKPAAGHSNLPTWTKNDNLAQAGIRMHISDAEKDHLHVRIRHMDSVEDQAPPESLDPNFAPRQSSFHLH
jgi:hypothetical protein